MNTIDESRIIYGGDCDVNEEKNSKRKVNGLEVAFSMVLFISAICCVWKASSLVISFVSLM